MKKRNTEDRMVNTGMRLTESEKRAIELAAARLHMTQSSYMRYTIFSVLERVDKQAEI